jgi:hypothetical protein
MCTTRSREAVQNDPGRELPRTASRAEYRGRQFLVTAHVGGLGRDRRAIDWPQILFQKANR